MVIYKFISLFLIRFSFICIEGCLRYLLGCLAPIYPQNAPYISATVNPFNCFQVRPSQLF